MEWSEMADRLLGTMPDDILAYWLKVPLDTVKRRRKERALAAEAVVVAEVTAPA